MKKAPKKLTLHRETLCNLSDLGLIAGGATGKTDCGTYCVTNCAACNFTPGSNCC